MQKILTSTLKVIALAALVFIVLIRFGFFSSEVQPVKSTDDSWPKVQARTIARLIKGQLGKNLKYVEYSQTTSGLEYLEHTKAKFIIKSGEVFTITYMEDTRPDNPKDHLGNWMSVKDIQTGEEFIDENIDGIPSLSEKPENINQDLWVQAYRKTLNKIYESM